MGGIGVICAILTVYIRIRQGRGAEGWINFYGQPQTWAGVAGLLIGLVVIVVGVALVVWIQLWKRSREEGVSMKSVFNDLRRQK